MGTVVANEVNAVEGLITVDVGVVVIVEGLHVVAV